MGWRGPHLGFFAGDFLGIARTFKKENASHCLYLAVYERRFQAAPRGGDRLDLCGPPIRAITLVNIAFRILIAIMAKFDLETV